MRKSVEMKKQLDALKNEIKTLQAAGKAVSYTHLDVYKRQQSVAFMRFSGILSHVTEKTP